MCIHVHVHVAMHSNTDPTAELQIARKKISELENLNGHIKTEVNNWRAPINFVLGESLDATVLNTGEKPHKS